MCPSEFLQLYNHHAKASSPPELQPQRRSARGIESVRATLLYSKFTIENITRSSCEHTYIKHAKYYEVCSVQPRIISSTLKLACLKVACLKFVCLKRANSPGEQRQYRVSTSVFKLLYRRTCWIHRWNGNRSRIDHCGADLASITKVDAATTDKDHCQKRKAT